MHATILNVFPGQTDDTRLVLVKEPSDTGIDQVVLLQESRSPHVGWFEQSRIPIDANQIAGLKMTLTSNLAAQAKSPAIEPGRPDEFSDRGHLLKFPAAKAG